MKYTINPGSFKGLEEDANLFLQDLEGIGSIGYVYPHFFNIQNEISSYGAIIIEKKNNELIETTESEAGELDFVKGIYKIHPNKIYSDGTISHLVFTLNSGVSKVDYKRISSALAYIYNGTTIDYHFFPEYKIEKKYEDKRVDKKLAKFLTQLYFNINNSDKNERSMSKVNFEEYLKTKEIPFIKIMEKLKFPVIDIDPRKNIHLKYGGPFEFVQNYIGAFSKTIEFFNKNFELKFEGEKSLDEDKYTRDGVLIEEGQGLFKGNVGYKVEIKGGEGTRMITDFFVKVFYKIKTIEGSYTYIVSLINDTEGIETDKIFWFNGTGKTSFSDYIQKYGSFHFYGSDANIKDLHREIAKTKNIPIIKNIIGYGFHKEDNIIIFKNGIWDIKERVFTEKKDDDKYFFNYNFKGYFVTDKQGNDLSLIIKDGVPELNVTKTADTGEIVEFMNSLYKDDTGVFLLSVALGMFGYMLHGNEEDPFPFIFAKGISGSGKTTFNDLLQKAWGIKKGGMDFGHSTVFTMTLILSHMIKFPYFLGEYRHNIEQARTKEGILRSVFDRKTQTKGRADQTMISYNYAALPVMDGEEMVDDGAIRTRTIQRHFITKHKIEGNFNKMVKDGGGALDHLLYTYLLKSSKEKYDKGYEEGLEYFSIAAKDSPRIWNNFASIYAGCYSFDPKFKKTFLDSLMRSCKDQIKDVRENSTSMQIIKAIGKFLDSSPFDSVNIVGTNVVISWNKLDEYVKRYRVDLSLKYETYKEHIEALGYEVGYIEDDNNKRMLYGVIIPEDNIPKEFLMNSDFYATHKKYQLKKQDETLG